MRDDEDHIRLYTPLLRRVIILVAVVIAVPVVLWTITAFMHAYVAPPTLPTFRPLAATNLITPADTATADTAASNTPPPAPTFTTLDSKPPQAVAPVATASAMAPSAPAAPSAPPAPTFGDKFGSAAVTAPKIADPAPMAPTAPQPIMADSTAAAAQSDAATGPAPVVAADPQPGSINAEAEPIPPGEPLTGPIPLPHPRPHVLAMAESGVPMPRPRPSAAADAATATDQDVPFWKKLFNGNGSNTGGENAN